MAFFDSWHIRSCSRHCAASGRVFEDGDAIMTALYPDLESSGYLRRDFAPAAWVEEASKAETKPFSVWKSIYQFATPGSDTEPSDRLSAEELLRRLIDEEIEGSENTRYILAVMLERKRLLRETDTKRTEDGILRVYEHRKTGEVFMVQDPDIPLDRIEAIQDEVFAMMESGGRAKTTDSSSSEEQLIGEGADGPTPTNFDVADFLERFSRAAIGRGFECEEIGTTEDGPVLAFVRESSPEAPRVYLSAGIHGDEPAGPLALLAWIEDGAGPAEERSWAICPALNPGGLAAGTRENRSGVDLNRDYFRLAAPETACHAAWLRSRAAPDLFISLHEDWEADGFYFYEINLGEDAPQRADAILASTVEWFVPEAGPLIDGHDSRAPGWIFHEAEADVPEGWPEAIFIAKHGCPLSFTFETPSRLPLASRIAAHRAAIAAAIATLTE